MKQLYNKAGKAVPSIGLGTFPFQGRTMADMVKAAVKEGYLLFDTADDYHGESGLGLAINEMDKEGLAKREDLFIQTKISDNNATANEPLKGVFFNPNNRFMMRHTAEEVVREKVSISLRELQTDYIDALLIHYPFPGYTVEIWKTMISLKNEGVVRYIGVSNFHERHIELLIKETGVCPEINECYTSPLGIKQSLVDYCNSHDCLFESYSPLKALAGNRLPMEVLQPIMDKYNKSMAQIVLRWNIQRGCLPLPKTQKPKRMKENMNIFDFELADNDMKALNGLNIDNQFLVESQICPGI